jgi:hypothetical protein
MIKIFWIAILDHLMETKIVKEKELVIGAAENNC